MGHILTVVIQGYIFFSISRPFFEIEMHNFLFNLTLSSVFPRLSLCLSNFHASQKHLFFNLFKTILLNFFFEIMHTVP